MSSPTTSDEEGADQPPRTLSDRFIAGPGDFTFDNSRGVGPFLIDLGEDAVWSSDDTGQLKNEKA